MSKLQSAENFAKERHSVIIRKDVTDHYEHLAGVVARLKNLGITDEEVLASAWLHDIIDDTETSFDELEQRFGSKISVMVLSISKDKNLPRAKQEEQYIKQLKESTFDAKLIKLCDISASLRDLKNAPVSKTKRIKEAKKKLFYLNVIKSDLIKNKSKLPGIGSLINGINEMVLAYGLRPVIFQ